MTIPLRWRYRMDRWRESVRNVLRPSPQSARPRLCPACKALVGSTATKCHVCGASLHFSLAAASRSLADLLPSTSPVTYSILVVNIFLFAVSLLATLRMSSQMNLLGGVNTFVLDRLGACRLDRILAGEWWRLVMPIFLHGGLLHIAMNSWVLMDVGPQVEEVYGSARYLFLYLFTGILGFVASALSGHFSVGASGALMGLIGAMLAITTRRGGAYMQMIRGQLIRWVIYILVIGVVIRGIDNAAHIGGLASGFLLGKVMADREPINAAERQRAYVLGWASGLVVLASFAAMFLSYFRLT